MILGARLTYINNIKPGLRFSANIDRSILSDFDNIWRGSKGSLPHVRTDLKNYLNKTSHTRIRDLNLASYYKLSNNLYGRFTAGYLEPMYAGISSELYLLDIFPNYQ